MADLDAAIAVAHHLHLNINEGYITYSGDIHELARALEVHDRAIRNDERAKIAAEIEAEYEAEQDKPETDYSVGRAAGLGAALRIASGTDTQAGAK